MSVVSKQKIKQPTSLALPEGVTKDEFTAILFDVIQVTKSHKWHSGDAIIEGEKRFGEDLVVQLRGEFFDGREEEDEQLERWVRVCRLIEPERRIRALSFSHHEAIATQEPFRQDELLKAAVDLRLTVKELRKMAKGEMFVDPETGHLIESADRVEQEIPSDQPTTNKADSAPNESIAPDRMEAMVEEAKQELCPTILRLERYLSALGALNDEFEDALQKMRQHGEVMR